MRLLIVFLPTVLLWCRRIRRSRSRPARRWRGGPFLGLPCFSCYSRNVSSLSQQSPNAWGGSDVGSSGRRRRAEGTVCLLSETLFRSFIMFFSVSRPSSGPVGIFSPQRIKVINHPHPPPTEGRSASILLEWPGFTVLLFLLLARAGPLCWPRTGTRFPRRPPLRPFRRPRRARSRRSPRWG